MQKLKLNFFTLLAFLCFSTVNLMGQAINMEKSIFDLMNYQEVLSVTLEADFTALDSTRRDAEGTQGRLTFEDEKGLAQSWEVKLTPRGNFRRLKCEMVPLTIDFDKKDLKAFGLAKFDDMKLVTHCVANKLEAKTLLQREYLAYKLYNNLTEYSYRVQLLKITYVDSGTGSKDKTWASLIEDAAQLKDRIGATAEVDNQFNLPRDTFHQGLQKIASVYQYMIGNSDWGFTTGKNLKYVYKNEKVIPIPYDFDFSGLVNASYATGNSAYGIRDVKTRVFLGFPEDVSNLRGTLAYFKSKRTDLLNTVDNFKALDKDIKNSIVEYLNSFFATMDEINI